MDSRLRNHLISGLLASVLFTALTGVTAIMALHVTTSTTIMGARALEEDLTLILHLCQEAQHLGAASRRYLVSGQDQHRLSLAAAEVEFEAARDRLKAHAISGGERQLLTVERDAEDYATAIRQAAYEQWASDPRKALAFLDDELRPKRTTLDSDAQIVVRAEQDSLHDTISHAERLALRAQWTLAFTSVLGIALALAFAAAMMRQLARESERTRNALDAARRASAARRDLINSSRDLRSQLDAIVVATAPRKPTDHGDDRRLATIAGVAERIRDTLDDLVEVSRIESGTIDLRCERLEVNGLVDAAVGPFRAQASERAIRIRTESPGSTTVYANRERIVEVLATLIEDAVSLARTAGEVTVTTTPAGGYVRFSVADTGPELLPRPLARLFQRAPTTSPADGNASLLLCKRIVEAHRGHFGIAREASGRTAWFTIPTEPGVLGRAP